MEKIDIVIPWVDGSDISWIKKRNSKSGKENVQLNGEERYRDFGTLKYLFRSIDMYAPWVGNVYLITDNQVPSWINLKNKRLKIVDHTDYIDEKYLPTFNSNVIELNLGNLDILSEHFVLFNDDTLLNNKVSPIDFFKNGKPVDSAILSPVFPTKDGIDNIVINNLKIINNNFKKKNVVKEYRKKFFNFSYGTWNLKNILLSPYSAFCGFYDFHLPVPYLKSMYKYVFNENEQEFKKTYGHNFRTNEDINHWLIRYWQFCTGKFNPRSVKFGKYFSIDDLNDIEEEIVSGKSKVICINDSNRVKDFKETNDILESMLEKKFPKKSEFEL